MIFSLTFQCFELDSNNQRRYVTPGIVLPFIHEMYQDYWNRSYSAVVMRLHITVFGKEEIQ